MHKPLPVSRYKLNRRIVIRDGRLDADKFLELAGSACGAIGALLLAVNNQLSPYGWLFFLASNVSFILFTWRKRYAGMLMMNAVFTATSVLGIVRWFW